MNARIGIDGGGTKTEFILVDETGAFIAQRRTAGCSPSILDSQAISKLISTTLEELLAAGRQTRQGIVITDTVFCMAGSRSFWSEFGAELTGYGRVQTFDDSIPVLELATAGHPGLVLHAGTGSFVAARGDDGTAHYAGGLGWRFGDPASAYDLGQHAIARTILELQGWAEPSGLGASICEATGIRDATALTRHFYSPSTTPPAIAAYGPLITTLAAQNDEAALGILTQSIGQIARLANEVIARVFAENGSLALPVGLSGLILQTPIAQSTLAATLDSRCQMSAIVDPPIEGVRRLLTRISS
jgi:glucosamine kinase|uniref:N-acetylglucosamine kinase n=1 Tax=Cephaloticoccus sp. TaxID=1985742 RepID=UPI00404AD2C5